MADRRTYEGFDIEGFLLDFNALRTRHGLLALDALVMVPLDAELHHIFKAQSGATQLHIDLIDVAARHPEALVKAVA